jgi:hypothetical protein
VKKDKEYDPKASSSRCFSRLLNEAKQWLTTTFSNGDMRQILLEDGAQMQTIGNWYTNIEK